MSTEKIQLYGEFALDLARGCLLRAGQALHLRPQSYEVLKHLAQNRGRLLSKDQLIEEVWQGRAVTDGSLGKCIEEVRQALGEEARLYLRNVRGRGYIFDPPSVDQGAEESWSERVDVVRLVIEDQEHGSEAVTSVSEASLPKARRYRNRRALSLAFASALLLGIAVIATYYVSSRSGRHETSSVKSLAVLPFKSLGAESGNEYLGLGIADTLITRLSNLKDVVIRPTSAVLKYAEGGKGVADIGRELGVDSVLEGSIHISGGRMRVTVQLVGVNNQTPLWADTFDGQVNDIFSVEDSISARLAEMLTNRLSSADRIALAKHYTENTEAHLLCLSGRYLMEKRIPEATYKAIEFFERAIVKDPNFALAYANIAECYFSLSVTGSLPPRQAFPKAKDAALKALEMDPLLAEAYCNLGITKFFHDWDWTGAEKDFQRAIEINPNYALAHEMYAHLLSNLGRPSEAFLKITRALELDPLSLIANAIKGQILYLAGQYDEASVHLQHAIDVEPNFWISRLTMGKVYERRGMYPQAIAQFQKSLDVSNAPEPKSYLAYTYAVSGKREEAHKLLNELKQASTQQYIAPKHIALVYAGLRLNDEMFAWLEKAYEDRDISLAFIKVEPRWDEYRSDPRFMDLMHRVGFTQ